MVVLGFTTNPKQKKLRKFYSYESDHIQIIKIESNNNIRYFGRFPVSQFNDSLGGVDLKCTQWVQFRSTQTKLYFPKIMEFSH